MKHSDSIETTVTQSAKFAKGRSANNIEFVGVLGIFCTLFLASVFIFDGVFSTFSTSDQIVLASHPVSSVNNVASTNQSNIALVADATLSQAKNGDPAVNSVKSGSTMSENDFRQEAQNIIRRDPESLDMQAANLNTHLNTQAMAMNRTISNEDFRVEAKQVLYRDENQ